MTVSGIANICKDTPVQMMGSSLPPSGVSQSEVQGDAPNRTSNNLKR